MSDNMAHNRWVWPVATLSTQLLIGLGLGIATCSGLGWSIVPLTALIFSSCFPVWFLVLLMVYTGRSRVLVRVVVLLLLAITNVWHIASFLRYRDQGHRLSAYDLWSGWQEPQIRMFMIQSLVSFEALLFLLASGLSLVLCWIFSRRLSVITAMRATWVTLIIATLGSLATSLPINMPGSVFAFFHGSARPAMAPWSRVHDGTMLFSFPTAHSEETANPNSNVARTLAQTAEGVEWRSPGIPVLANLRGQYADRDIVVIILESHRLSDVAPFGKGAFDHRDLSPNVSGFARNSWWFSNYFQPGHGSIWSIYSTLTGLTPPVSLSNHHGAGAESGNRLTAQGLLPLFRSLGYQCDFLVGCEYTFWDLAGMLEHAGASGEWSAEEEHLQQQAPRSPWGVDDDAIYELAQRRIERARKQGERRLQILKTSSNHQPFYFRPSGDGTQPPKNHIGGMRYADERFGRFMHWINQIPAETRPIVFVTGDHGHTERLLTHAPLYTYSLEALRIPGFLQLPDGRHAGDQIDMLMSHQDLLALLLLLVDRAPRTKPEKFVDRHRHALAFVQASGYGVLTKDLYRPFWASPQDGKVFAMTGYWTVQETNDPDKIQAMNDLHRQYLKEHEALWNLHQPGNEP